MCQEKYCRNLLVVVRIHEHFKHTFIRPQRRTPGIHYTYIPSLNIYYEYDTSTTTTSSYYIWMLEEEPMLRWKINTDKKTLLPDVSRPTPAYGTTPLTPSLDEVGGEIIKAQDILFREMSTMIIVNVFFICKFGASFRPCWYRTALVVIPSGIIKDNQ